MKHRIPTFFINVFGYDIEDNIRNESKNEVYQLRITPNEDRLHHVNLLLLSDTNSRKPYCLVSSINKLLFSLTKYNRKSFYCDYCLHRFSTEHGLSEHLPYCTPYGEQKTKMPTEEEKFMSFKNYAHCLKVPFTVYADFESLITPLQSCSPGNDIPTTVKDLGDFYSVDSSGVRQKIPSPPVSSTSYEAMHIPSGFSYAIVDHAHSLWRLSLIHI